MPLLPYLMADCQVVAPIARGIGTRGPFSPVAAMVVMVVVVGHWRLGVQFFGVQFYLRHAPRKHLSQKQKLQTLITQALARDRTLKEGIQGTGPQLIT